MSTSEVTIAVAGCLHGHLNQLYTSLSELQSERSNRGLPRAELLIVCGDFQSIRNGDDMMCMAVPPKYAFLGDFHEYYSGKKRAPILTIFVGGNHEASNYLWELYYGGWVAPNIYFLGFSSVIRYRGLRIAGLSGIYHPTHHLWNYVERVPFDNTSIRSVFHTRLFEVKRLQALRFSPVDIMVTHDWPRGITNFGDTSKLLQVKPYFEDDIKSKRLGNPLTWKLLEELKPRYWFAAHLHVKFSAQVHHDSTESHHDTKHSRTTNFLALDKPLPSRHFLQILDIPVFNQGRKESSTGPSTIPSGDSSSSDVDKNSPVLTLPPRRHELVYDVEWLAIIRLTHSQLPNTPTDLTQAGLTSARIMQEMSWVSQNIPPEQMRVPPWEEVFVADVPSGAVWSNGMHERFLSCKNIQTERFIKLLGLSSNPFCFDGLPPAARGLQTQQGRTTCNSTRPNNKAIEQALHTANVTVSLLDKCVERLLEQAQQNLVLTSRQSQQNCDSQSTSSDDCDETFIFSCSCTASPCTCQTPSSGG